MLQLLFCGRILNSADKNAKDKRTAQVPSSYLCGLPYFAIKSFKALPALNAGTVEAAILILAPV